MKMKPLCQNVCRAIFICCDFIGLFWKVFLRPLFILGVNDVVYLEVILKMRLSPSNLNNNNNNLLLIRRKYLYEYIQMRLTSYIKIIIK